MSQFENLVEDYARKPVPREKTVSGLRIALIIIGVAITLPAFLTGATFGQQLGLTQGLLAFVMGGAVVTLAAALTGVVGARTGLPTAVIVRSAFGSKGASVVNAVLLTTFFGWFGVTLALFASALGDAMVLLAAPMVPDMVLLLAGSIAMIAVTVFGFKALDRLSLVAVPLMLVFLCWLVYRALAEPGQTATVSGGGGSVGLAASAVAGAFMVGATMMPDLCRYARSSGHAILASVLAFGIGYPGVLLLAAIPAIATGEIDMIKIVFSAGLGLSGLFLIVFASLTTNASNLYSSSLVLSALVTQVAKWKLVIVAGALGSIFAALGIMERLVDFLILLGVVIPPIAGIFVTDHWLRSTSDGAQKMPETEQAVSLPAMLAWAIACGIGISTTSGVWSLSGISALDSMVASAVVFYVLKRPWG